MYCSTCGVAVAHGLSYCNYCGAKLNPGDTKASEVTSAYLVFAIMAVFVFGTLAISVLMGVLKRVLDLPIEGVVGFTLVPFLLLLVIEAVFIRLLLRRTRSTDTASTTAPLKGQAATRELDAAQPRELPEPKPSVTEHTTRAFDPIYTERK